MNKGMGIYCLSVIAVLAWNASAGAAGGEKLLFGFEKDEISEKFKKSEGAKFKELKENAFQFYAPGGGTFREREMTSIRPMRCYPGKVSQGTHSCRIRETFGTPDDGRYKTGIPKNLISYPSFRLPRLGALPLHTGEAQANLRMPELLNTSGWFEWVMPQDWSGYDLLRVDVNIESIGQVGKLLFEVEDDLVEPPVSYTYEAPEGGKWVTIEMDLAEAVTDRGLNLTKMNNIWLRVNLKDAETNALKMETLKKKPDELNKYRFLAYVDNIRIAKKGTPCAHPILKGIRSPYTISLPRSYATEENFQVKSQIMRFPWPDVIPVEKKMPEAAKKATTPAAPVTKLETSVIPIRDMIVKGCFKPHKDNARLHDSIRLSTVASVDGNHIVVGFFLLNMGGLKNSPEMKSVRRVFSRHCAAAVRTTDGGKTWKGLDGKTDWPTVLGGNTSKVPFRLTDIGGDIIGITYFGCGAIVGAHYGYPADRAFMTRSVFTGDGWWKSPKYFVSGDPRSCHSIEWGDFALLPSGRLWVGWSGKGRPLYREGSKGRKRSFAYYSDDNGASWTSWRGPGKAAVLKGVKGRDVRLAPYKGHVAMFGEGSWTWFNGKTWSKIESTGSGRMWSSVSCGDEIYLGGLDGPSRWYDGKTWQDFKVPGRTGTEGRIGLCGGKTLVFVERAKDQKQILCWRKKQGGQWVGPEVLVEEKTKITKIAHQRYAPADFLPIAYTCANANQMIKTPKHATYNLSGFYPWLRQPYEPWIKVLKVPAEK